MKGIARLSKVGRGERTLFPSFLWLAAGADFSLLMFCGKENLIQLLLVLKK